MTAPTQQQIITINTVLLPVIVSIPVTISSSSGHKELIVFIATFESVIARFSD